jgi:hypothetical protein
MWRRAAVRDLQRLVVADGTFVNGAADNDAAEHR